jgi:hypothetical protein
VTTPSLNVIRVQYNGYYFLLFIKTLKKDRRKRIHIQRSFSGKVTPLVLIKGQENKHCTKGEGRKQKIIDKEVVSKK